MRRPPRNPFHHSDLGGPFLAFAPKFNDDDQEVRREPLSDDHLPYPPRLQRAAVPHTCTAYAASCLRNSSARPDRSQMCQAAKAQCLQTGLYVGPYSGRQFAGMQKM